MMSEAQQVELGKAIKEAIEATLDPQNPAANLDKSEELWIVIAKKIISFIIANAEVPAGIQVQVGGEVGVTSSPGRIT